MRVISCLTTGRLSGVDVFAVQLTRGLSLLGHEAEILLTEPSFRVPDPMPLPRDLAVRQMPAMSRWLGPRRRRWLHDYLVRKAPCVYLPNYDYRHSAVSAVLPVSVICVGHVHSDDPMHYDHARHLGRFWNATVAVSQTVAEKTKSACPEIAARLSTIPYGVPVPESVIRPYRTAGAPLQVLYTGRIDQTQKRSLDLLAILERSLALGANVQLTVLGGGAALGAFLTSAERLLQQGKLRVLPTVPNEQLAEAYARADVLLLPSAFEGLPLSLLEAMAHGCVPVVSDISSGVPEVVEQGVHGFRVGVGDVNGFAQRLVQLAADTELCRRMSEAAHARIANGPYRADKMAARYAELFEQLFADVRSGRYQRPQQSAGRLALEASWIGFTRRARRLLPSEGAGAVGG